MSGNDRGALSGDEAPPAPPPDARAPDGEAVLGDVRLEEDEQPIAAPRAAAPRCIAVVGPYGSGKTSLVEAMRLRGDDAVRAAACRDGGHAVAASHEAGRTATIAREATDSPESRVHAMGTEATVTGFAFMGDDYALVDCPGSIEFCAEIDGVVAASDLALVVCEADARKLPALQVILKNLEERGIPRVLFLNKIDRADGGIRETLEMLQGASRTPLVLRQMPIWRDGIATGFVDLALERAYVYREHAASRVMAIPDIERARQVEARFEMLERVADYDDALLEELLSDIEPPRDRVFDDLAREMAEGLICPVFIGSAARGNGVFRLMKALRHESPCVDATRTRLGLDADGGTVVQVMKTLNDPHLGKLSLARVLSGSLAEQATLFTASGAQVRSTGLYRLEKGREPVRRGPAGDGEIAALARLDGVATGATLTSRRGGGLDLIALAPPPPVLAVAVAPAERKDETRLTGALQKLCEEDGGLAVVADAVTGEIRLCGQGEMHLKAAIERLSGRFGLDVLRRPPRVAYREAIAGTVTVHSRHKKQSGGHGQFADITVAFSPGRRGAGFRFSQEVIGGTVPKTYFGAVEAGIAETLGEGPLGFPVVDLAAVLMDGAHHPVDSSEQAFRAAAHLAVREALVRAGTVLLEPVLSVVFDVPTEATARIAAIAAARRGHITACEPRASWPGWDTVHALIPEAGMQDLILDVRSASAGVGAFRAAFHHLAEVEPRLAAEIAERRRRDAA